MERFENKGYLRLSDIVRQKEVTQAEAAANRAALDAAVRSGDTKVIGRAKAKPRKARHGSPGILPISRSSWLAGVRDGRYPKPIHLSSRTTVWRTADVMALVESISALGSV